MLDPEPQWNKGISVTQRLCHPSSVPNALVPFIFFLYLCFFKQFFFAILFLKRLSHGLQANKRRISFGVFLFVLFKRRGLEGAGKGVGGLQKSTSQPELSSGGGSSLSSGKLSKLPVSTGDLTWLHGTKESLRLKSNNAAHNEPRQRHLLWG